MTCIDCCPVAPAVSSEHNEDRLLLSSQLISFDYCCCVTLQKKLKKKEAREKERQQKRAAGPSSSLHCFSVLLYQPWGPTITNLQLVTYYDHFPWKAFFFLNYYQLVVIIRRSHPLASFLTFNGYVSMIGINFIHIKHWRCQHWKLNEPRKINLKLKCIHDPYSILRVRWGRHEQCRFKSGRLINEVETATSTSNKSTNCRMRIRSQRTPLQNPTSMPYENNPDSAPIGFDGISPPIRPLRSLDHAAELISIISCYFQ